MKGILQGVRELARRHSHRIPGPLGSENIIPLVSDEDADKERDARVLNVVRTQAEGSVLLASGDIDTRGFELIDEDHPGIKDA